MIRLAWLSLVYIAILVGIFAVTFTALKLLGADWGQSIDWFMQ